MTAQSIATSTSASRAELEGAASGPVLWAGDPRIAGELAGVNTAVTHRPVAVVGATAAGDVAAAVRFANRHGLAVEVHATGHGGASSDGTLIVTTHRMQRFDLDPGARQATVAAGVTWAPVIAAAAMHGLAPLSGSSSGTGVVGYTICGGAGPMVRRYGYAADHVRSIELVTADGRIRLVDARHDPDLFWAVRGGKGNFGLVTGMTFDLMPVARLYGGALYYSGTHAAAVLHAYRDWVATLGEDTTTSIALMRMPDLPAVPPPLRGKCTVHLRVAHLGHPGKGERVLAPMRTAAPALIDRVRNMSVAEVDTIHNDPTEPRPSWGRGMFLRDLPVTAVDALLAVAGPERDLPLAMIEIRHLGGAAGREPDPPNSTTGRDAAFAVGVVGPFPPPLRAAVSTLGQSVLDALRPWTGDGIPIQYPAALHSADDIDRAWSPSVYARLLTIKRRHDPNNVFRVGNVVIAATS